MRLLALLALSFVALAGCKGNCRQLAERLCDCSVNSVERDACLRTASAAEGSNPADTSAELRCALLLRPADGGVGCDCRLLDTRAGKIRCGLARPGDDPDAGN